MKDKKNDCNEEKIDSQILKKKLAYNTEDHIDNSSEYITFVRAFGSTAFRKNIEENYECQA